MKRFAILLTCFSLVLGLAACGGSPAAGDTDDTLHVLATTYPVYLFATAVTDGAEDVQVDLLVSQSVSCLHDYTLTVNDMKAIEKADVILMNGAGLEDFMSDALAASDAAVIDCAQDLALLPAAGHEEHDHDGEYDPHIWMSPSYAAEMMGQIAMGLEELTGDAGYHTRYLAAKDLLAAVQNRWEEQVAPLSGQALITFHDGFQYFAQAFGLTLLRSIEEEEGSEASAGEIKEIISLVGENHIPAIFTEVNGSDATARTIARETGCAVYPLNMIMSGNGTGIQAYIDAMQANLDTLTEALS